MTTREIRHLARAGGTLLRRARLRKKHAKARAELHDRCAVVLNNAQKRALRALRAKLESVIAAQIRPDCVPSFYCRDDGPSNAATTRSALELLTGGRRP